MRHTLFVLFLCLTAAGAVAAWAQDGDESEQTYNLLHTTLEEQEAQRIEEESVPVYEPVIPERNLEVTLTLGFWQLEKTLLEYENIIYKYTEKDTYFGDVVINGASAFHPQLRVNYNVLPWFAVEPVLGFSVSEYMATIANAQSLSNQAFGEEENVPVPVEEVGEYDPENRSCITMSTGFNAVFYPLDYGNFGKGRWHPFVQGGVHRTWMFLNSNYTDDAATMWDTSFGGGLRFIADDLISVRLEVMYHRLTADFTPGASFDVRDEGTTVVPITSWVEGQGEVTVGDFDSHSLNSLSWAVGFTADF